LWLAGLEVPVRVRYISRSSRVALDVGKGLDDGGEHCRHHHRLDEPAIMVVLLCQMVPDG